MIDESLHASTTDRDSLKFLVTGDFRGLNGADLGEPTNCGLHLAHRAEFIRSVAWNADVVRALKHKLNVANLENLGAALFGNGAGGVQEAVDKRVGEVEDRLYIAGKHDTVV